MSHHTKDKGDIATMLAMADLTKKGYVILTPTVSEHLRFDFVAYKNNKFYRIQAKYSVDRFAPNKTVWNDKHGTHINKYSEEDFDYYAIYVPQYDTILYPSIKFGGHYFTFEVPNSSTSFYWHEDFLNFTDNASKKTYKNFEIELTFIQGSEKHSEKCKHAHISARKVERPSKEELEKLLWKKPTTQIAIQFGVSDKAIEKWAKAYGLSKPPRGYWAKLKAA